MEVAVKRILAALDQGERIVLFGDYDVDGVASLALLSEMIVAFGGSPKSFSPREWTRDMGSVARALNVVWPIIGRNC